jgi:hypothetical protein
MKKVIPRVYLILVAFLIQCTVVKSQINPYPPAQVPPAANGTGGVDVQAYPLSNYLNFYIRDTILPQVNEQLRVAGMALIYVSYTFEEGKPYMGQTTYTYQPNEKRVIIPLEIKYKLNITGLPDRYLRQSIKITSYCKNWSTAGGGKAEMLVDAEKPQLIGETLTEQIINAATFNNLTNFITKKINENLPVALNISITSLIPQLNNFRCNCINLNQAPTQLVKDTWVTFQYNNAAQSMSNTKYSVSIKKIKKLNITDLQDKPLFTTPENLQITYFINQKPGNTSISGIGPGQEKFFPENNFILSKPEPGENIVIIASINRGGGDKDAGFIVLDQINNFGISTKKIFIQRSYTTKPTTLENGTTVKGVEVKANAYEITIEIRNYTQEVIKRN